MDVVCEQLRRQIINGEYAPEVRLPAERGLAESLGVNRLTLRAALSRLQAEGLVEPRQGDGVRVLDFRAHGGIDLVPHLTEGRLSIVRGFLELRRAMAAEALSLSCTRATPEDLAELRALAESQQEDKSPELFLEGDLAFARALLRAAKNLPLELLFNTVARMYVSYPQLVEALHQDQEAVRLSYFTVVELMENRDPDLAQQAVRAALQLIDEDALNYLKERGWSDEEELA